MSQTVYHGVPASAARAVCVLVHGRGQTPREMIDSVLSRLDTPGVRFVLPAAPGGTWYDARAADPLTDATVSQLDASLGHLADAVTLVRAECPALPVVLAGFSQGACLAVEYLMRGGSVDGAAILTGCRVGAPSDTLPRAALAGLPVYMTCSDEDPWIPLWAFQKAVSEVAASGARIRTDILPGRAHEVADLECAEVSRLLSAVAAGELALGGTA